MKHTLKTVHQQIIFFTSNRNQNELLWSTHKIKHPQHILYPYIMETRYGKDVWSW